jgi:hypothetical protein
MASQRVVLDPFAGTGTIGEANLACLRRPVFHQKIEQRDLLAMEGMAAECRPAREGYATWPRESRMRTAMAETSRGQPRYGQSLSCLSTLAPQPHPAVGLPFAIPACEGKHRGQANVDFGGVHIFRMRRSPRGADLASDPNSVAALGTPAALSGSTDMERSPSRSDVTPSVPSVAVSMRSPVMNPATAPKTDPRSSAIESRRTPRCYRAMDEAFCAAMAAAMALPACCRGCRPLLPIALT